MIKYVLLDTNYSVNFRLSNWFRKYVLSTMNANCPASAVIHYKKRLIVYTCYFVNKKFNYQQVVTSAASIIRIIIVFQIIRVAHCVNGP